MFQLCRDRFINTAHGRLMIATEIFGHAGHPQVSVNWASVLHCCRGRFKVMPGFDDLVPAGFAGTGGAGQAADEGPVRDTADACASYIRHELPLY